jgi:hypothetical protein
MDAGGCATSWRAALAQIEERDDASRQACRYAVHAPATMPMQRGGRAFLPAALLAANWCGESVEA